MIIYSIINLDLIHEIMDVHEFTKFIPLNQKIKLHLVLLLEHKCNKLPLTLSKPGTLLIKTNTIYMLLKHRFQ